MNEGNGNGNGNRDRHSEELPRSTGEALEMILYELAMIKTSVDAVKLDLSTIVPRLDTLTAEVAANKGRQDTIAAEVRAMGQRFHKTNNTLASHMLELSQYRAELHSVSATLGGAVEVLENKVRATQDAIADQQHQ